MTKNENVSDLANRLINVNVGIFKIYNALADSYDNYELHRKNLDYLKVALEVEDNIYKKIGEDLLKSKNFEHPEFGS